MVHNSELGNQVFTLRMALSHHTDISHNCCVTIMWPSPWLSKY